MVAETIHTFTAADITSLVIECRSCGAGISLARLDAEALPEPGALSRCPGCEREWWPVRGPATALSPERRLVDALIDVCRRDVPAPAVVKLMVATDARGDSRAAAGRNQGGRCAPPGSGGKWE